MPGGHDRHAVICFAGVGDPRSFYLEALGEPWVGLWCLWGGLVPQQPRLSYLSFPCGRECILGVSRGAGGPLGQRVMHPVAACGAVAPIKNSCWLSSCIAA